MVEKLVPVTWVPVVLLHASIQRDAPSRLNSNRPIKYTQPLPSKASLFILFYQNIILTFLPVTLNSIVAELLVTDPHLGPDLNLHVIIS